MADSREAALRLADFLPYQLSIASNAVSNRIAEVYRARFGLKIPEWRVMAVLGDRGALTQRELTEATVMDKVAVNRACKALEARGLLVREPNAQDGRSHHLALTSGGQAMHGRIMPLALEMERELFGGLDPADRATFSRLLALVRDEAGRDSPASR
ncbi:MAG: MarR family winged helix-turn-helix transcriptional regulator [Sphingomonadaceae bacterium]